MQRIILVILLLLAIGAYQNVCAQGSDQQLATHYFQAGDYEKAVMYYEKLYKTNGSKSNYVYYLKCMIELQDFKIAEKVVKKEIKNAPGDLSLRVDLGQVYLSNQNDSKANQQFNLAIKEINPKTNYSQVQQLANAFVALNKIDLAIEAYQKAQKTISTSAPFNIRIGELYGLKGETALMVNEFVGMLQINEGYMSQVQGALLRAIDIKEDKEKYTILKSSLLRAAQQHPGQTVYNEMLIWLFQHKGDFKMAFLQVKALDKKGRAQGERVVGFGDLCHNNSEFDIAVKAFEYVIELGSDKYYYRRANIALLKTLNKKITSTANYTQLDLETLESKYLQSLTEMGESSHSIMLMKDLAHLQAFYLHNNNSAKDLLERALKLPGLGKRVLSMIKLELADILVMNGEIWDASLYYSQVEKSFKEDKLGHEAKYRNARIFYYTGNFGLAKVQLDVLKASTTKLIANDAMELSLLITDNLALDTTMVTMNRYAKADLYIFQNKFDEALVLFDSINSEMAYHSLNDEILYKRYEIAMKRREPKEAETYLMQIVKDYPDDILADNALYALAELHEYTFKNKEQAAEYYKQLMFSYQGSMFKVEARKRYRAIVGDDPKELRTIEKPEEQ